MKKKINTQLKKKRKKNSDNSNSRSSKAKKSVRPNNLITFHDPLLKPLAEIPEFPNNFYFEELLRWLNRRSPKTELNYCVNQDYIIKHKIFPPEPSKSRNATVPVEQVFENLTLEDFDLKNVDVRDKRFPKSLHIRAFLFTILERIECFPDEFVSTYTKIRSVTTLLNQENNSKFQGEIKCIELLLEELANFQAQSYSSLIPVLYHYRNHGLIMSSDFNKLEVMDVEVEQKFTYEFGFSKQTSNNFFNQLISILIARKKWLVKTSINPVSHVGNILENDTRINCKLTKEKIRKYFLRLNSINKKGQIILSKEDIEHFLHANFADFYPKKEVKILDANITIVDLRYFVYLFWENYANDNDRQITYINLLLNNFKIFQNTKLSTLERKFAEEPPNFPTSLNPDI